MTYSDAPTTAYLSGWPFYLTDRVSPTLPRRGGTQPRPVSTSLGRTGQPQTSRSHSGGVVERDTYVSPTARGRQTG